MDAVHVPDPACGALECGPVAAGGGRARRSTVVDDLPAHCASGHLARDGDRHPDPRARPRASVRRRLGADPRRPRYDDGDDLDLHLCHRLQAVRDELHRRGRIPGHRDPDGDRDLRAEAHGDCAVTRTARRRIRLALRYFAAATLTVIFLFPLYWLFMISFKTPAEIFAFPPVWWPQSMQFANYAVLFKDGDVMVIWNSLVIAGVSTVLALFIGTMAAYSLVRFRTGG